MMPTASASTAAGAAPNALEEAAEGLVHQLNDLGQLVLVLIVQVRGAELADLGHALLLGGEDVEGDEYTEGHVHDGAEELHDEGPEVDDEIRIRHEAAEGIQQLLHSRLGATEQVSDPGGQFFHVRDVHVQMHPVDEGLDVTQQAVEVGLVVLHQILDGAVQLGKDQRHQQGQNTERRQEGAEQGKAQAELALALQLTEDEVFVELEQGVEQVGDDAADEQGRQNSTHKGEEGLQLGHVDKTVGQNEDHRQRAEKEPALLEAGGPAGLSLASGGAAVVFVLLVGVGIEVRICHGTYLHTYWVWIQQGKPMRPPRGEPSGGRSEIGDRRAEFIVR